MYERIRAVMQPPTGKEKLRRQSGGVVVIILLIKSTRKFKYASRTYPLLRKLFFI